MPVMVKMCSLVVLDEIQERRQFLADMASLGQEGQYIHIMNTEISQVNNSVSRCIPLNNAIYEWFQSSYS